MSLHRAKINSNLLRGIEFFEKMPPPDFFITVDTSTVYSAEIVLDKDPDKKPIMVKFMLGICWKCAKIHEYPVELLDIDEAVIKS